MPRYDIECPRCEVTTEETFSHKALVPVCPTCKGERKRVILAAPAYKLRGSGWAQDGYANTNQGDQAMADTADRKGAISSFPGQQNRSRIADGDLEKP